MAKAKAKESKPKTKKESKKTLKNLGANITIPETVKMLEDFGFSNKEAIKTSKQLEAMSLDLATFTNKNEVLEALNDPYKGLVASVKLEAPKPEVKKTNTVETNLIKQVIKALDDKDYIRIIQAGRDLMSYGKSKL